MGEDELTDLPILVQFEYHTAAPEAAELAEYLYHALNDDPAVPGLRIPVLFVRHDDTGAPEPRVALEAERVLVVLLAEDRLAAHARRPSSSTGRTWGDYAVALRGLCDANPAHSFMPVQLTQHAWPIDDRLEDLNFLRAWAIDDEALRKRFIARGVIQFLLRRLQPHSAPEDAPPLTIFLSHTKLDLESEPRVVKSLLAHLTANQPHKTWFDSGDIEVGSRFAKEIEDGVRDAALLAVLTDSYSSRSWCRREVLLAKHFQRPVVVVDAVQEREVRSFPYVGNVPVVRWKGDAQETIDVLLREALRQAYAAEYLERRKRSGDVVLSSGPELVTLVHRNAGDVILYPDPPLGAEELAIIEPTGIRIETPLERHAQQSNLSTHSLSVALSISEAEDLERHGQRRAQLDATLLEISRFLLISGTRLAYGGHLGNEGYTVRLADLLRDPAVEHLRRAARTNNASAPQLLNFVPWPSVVRLHDQARLGPLVDVRQCARPSELSETLDPLFEDPVRDELPADSSLRRYAWARSLSEMRKSQVASTSARVAIGGRMGAATKGYRGRMPGALEEIVLSLAAKEPVFVVGAFGGCAHLVVEAIEGRQPVELTWGYHQQLPFVQELRDSYGARSASWDEYDDIFRLLSLGGFDCLCNGLSPVENRQLATTRSTEHIVELILTGLRRLFGDG